MKIQTIDWLLYLVTILLTIFGIVVIYSITYGQEATRNFAQNQLIFSILGLAFLVGFSILDYRFLKTLAYPLYGLLLVLLAFLIFTSLGKTTFGATRWLNLGFFQFQPSELFKLAEVIIISKICAQEELRIKHFLWAVLCVILPVILVLKQPDFGTAIIFFLIGATLISVAGFEKKYLIVLGSLVALFVLIFTLSAFSVGPFSRLLKDYQKERVITFLNPQRDPFGSGYNVSQAVIAIGSGGLFGRGLGYGPQSQLNFIPSKHTDFIFSVAAEAFGFVGASVILGLFFVLLLRILKTAAKARDSFGTLLSYGILTYFVSSVFINTGMNMGLLPTTGIPLPLMSYGGTSLITSLSAIGICQSVVIRYKKIVF